MLVETGNGNTVAVISRSVAVCVVALVLVSGPSAAEAAPEDCPYGAISAVGPVGAEGIGDATPDVRCLEP
jgi:hypothetical protein